jgi:hypothetical protein
MASAIMDAVNPEAPGEDYDFRTTIIPFEQKDAAKSVIE